MIRANNGVIGAVLGLAGMVFPGLALATEVVQFTGEENYQRLCASCHGTTGRGDGPVSAVIVPNVPDLTTIAARNNGYFPRRIVKNLIDGRWSIQVHGTRQMPVWGYEFWISEGAGDFSEIAVSKTLDDLVDYLESIQEQPVT